MHERTIFAFWTGDNAIPDIRKRCFDTFAITGLEPVLVTSGELHQWVVPSHPIHQAYEYLSPIHRADYLRAYFLLHHGGGYADIKQQTGSWLPAVEKVLSSRRLMGAGYRQLRGGMPWLQNNAVGGRPYVHSWASPPFIAKLVTDAMRGFYPLLIGPSAFYFKPGTLFGRIWLKETERRLDMLLPDLKLHPPCHPRDRLCGMPPKESLAGEPKGEYQGYPVPWSFLLADVEEPLSLAFCWALSRDLPAPRFDGYLA